MNTISQAGNLKRRREEGICIRTGKFVKLNIETEIVPALTKFIRKVVKEELESKLSVEDLKASLHSGAAEKPYKLVFKADLGDTIYKDSKIKAKENDVEVALYDTVSNSVVRHGPLSSIKVEICALNGDFGSNNGRWSTSEFKHNIVHQREDKAMLLKGETVITLKEGVGHINFITFTGNSKRTRSSRYRLGAIVHLPCHQQHVGEAVSNPFRVKESRGNTKNFPPSPKDEIWRLVNISKDGHVHDRLFRHLKIQTVEDLLRFDNPTDRPLLQKTFGQGSRKLRETLKHAKTSCQGQKCHSQNIIINSDDDKQHVEETLAFAHTFPGPMASLQHQDQLGKGQDFVQPSTSTPHVAGADSNGQFDFETELFELLPPETRIEGNNDWDYCF
ncbi:calmodulin-binding protein 60 B-like isoform X1 [Arachis duranensis]|uniref:Calmodulin-binding protein 60 B-like isoform X1 n=1 Tax=Arachis duranensis TaxID=130453 RepID=A0A6P4DL89_ARADU|nr:calmodulin-binding protein 60 B-like isoform X1 [Arachis duranensis]